MDKNLAGALLQAQSSMGKLVYDSNNPHFKSKYASLTAVLDTVRGPLSDAGLVLYQSATASDGCVMVRTMLVHAASGESIEEMLPLPVAQQTPQAYGSAITYGRRYLAMAMCGLAPDDDDGEAGSQTTQRPQNRTNTAPAPNRTAQHRNTPQRPANPAKKELDSITVVDAEPLAWDEGGRDAEWQDMAAETDANAAADKKEAAPFVWPKSRELIELCTGFINIPDLDEQVYTFVNDIQGKHKDSNGPMSDKQYPFLAGLLNKRYGDNSHNSILSALCGTVVSGENPPGWKAKVLIDWVKEDDANVTTLDAMVDSLKADLAQFA